MQTNAFLMSPDNSNVPTRSYFCLRNEYERIYAFGKALGWEQKPYEFVVAKFREIAAFRNKEERIIAFGKALGWEDKPHEFVAAKYDEVALSL